MELIVKEDRFFLLCDSNDLTFIGIECHKPLSLSHSSSFIGLFVVVVCSGLTSLSTTFQSYHDGVWLRQGAQCSLFIVLPH